MSSHLRTAQTSRTARAIVIACLLAGAARPAGAQDSAAICMAGTVVEPRAVQGAIIRGIDVVTYGLRVTGTLGRVAEELHARTQPEVVRRQLLLAPGKPFDTTAFAESVHRLRRAGYLARVDVTARQCRDSSGVTIAVTTTDAWSTDAGVVLGTRNAIVRVAEHNAFGTGREVGAQALSDHGRTGIGVVYRDPWLIRGAAAGAATWTSYRDGTQGVLRLWTRQRSVFDVWRAEVSVIRTLRIGRGPLPGDTLHRTGAQMLVSRRLIMAAGSGMALIAGAEVEQVHATTIDRATLAGPSAVRRRFDGIDLGLRRQSMRYDTIDWLLPAGDVVDLPLGTESDAVVGIGQDLATRRAMLHPDLWAGRIWHPTARALVIGDAWLNGFGTRREWSAATERVAFTILAGDRHGLWSVRAATEQLVDPDPNVRALVTLDDALPALPPRDRLAETALASTLERTLHMSGAHAGYVLDGGLFVAASLHEEPTGSEAERLGVVAVGTGLRLSPVRLARATLRLDVGYPVARTAGVPQRAFLGLSVVPWLESGRRRQGP